MHGRYDALASEYIRLFFETGGCDEVCDLKRERKDYEAHLGAERLARIFAFDDSHKEEDEARALQATLRYAHLHERQLVRCLPLWERVQHYTIDRFESPPATGYATSSWLKDPVAIEEAVDAAIAKMAAGGSLTASEPRPAPPTGSSMS